jgi:hypothetical protein
MNANYLFLVDSGSALVPAETDDLAGTTTEELVKKSRNTELSLFMREPAIQELAYRRNPAVIDICNSLIRRRDFDSWFVVVRALAHLGTPSAKDALLAMGSTCGPSRLRILVNFLGRLVGESESELFCKLIQGIAKPNSIDVSGWTKAAFHSLLEVHRTHGTRLVWNSSRKMSPFVSSFVTKTGKKRPAVSEPGTHKPLEERKKVFI